MPVTSFIRWFVVELSGDGAIFSSPFKGLYYITKDFSGESYNDYDLLEYIYLWTTYTWIWVHKLQSSTNVKSGPIYSNTASS